MRCIFCKSDSSNSRSIEHIIPESLGNKSHFLPKGVVCDKCNNYFSHKIEKEVLELDYFKSLRGRNSIENKKGKIPALEGFFKNPNIPELELHCRRGKIPVLTVHDDKYLCKIINGEITKFYTPFFELPPLDNIFVSKLIGKIALEALAQRYMKEDQWNEEFITNESIDPLRYFVRYGNPIRHWPYFVRKIYNENRACIDIRKPDIAPYQILHEYSFLIPKKPIEMGELQLMENVYLVCAILGVEYVINLTENGLSAYFEWLKENNNTSILMMEEYNSHF